MTRFAIALALAAVLAACGADRTLAPGLSRNSFGAGSAAPSHLGAGAASDVRIDLSWQDNSTNEGGFEVHRSTTGVGGAFTLLAATSPNVTAYTDSGLIRSTEYCYQVRAVRRRESKLTYSDFTNPACATTMGPPVAPSNLTTRPAQPAGDVRVEWSASSMASRYRMLRSASGEEPWDSIGGSTWTSYTDTGRPAEQQVCYRVIAVNGYGESDPSRTSCTAIPAAPTAVAATSTDGTSILVTWTDNSAVEDGYEAQRALPGYEPDVSVTLAPNATSFRDTTVAPDTRYQYRVRSRRDGGVSAFSAAYAIASTAPPSAPTEVTALPQSSSSVLVTWYFTASNEQGFRVERSTDGGTTWTTAHTAGWGSEFGQAWFEDVDRTPDQEVRYRVFAFNGAGDSPASNVDVTAPPRAPTNVSARATASGIDLTWHDESNVEDGYEVQYYVCDESTPDTNCIYHRLAVLTSGTTSWRDVDAADFRNYVVFAFKDKGSLRGYSDPTYLSATWP